jgi:hypothetical protein
MDGYLASFIAKLQKIKKKDWDAVLIIDGKERAGKSVLAQQIGYAVDPTLTLDRICFTPKEFHEAIVNAEKGTCVIMDEAMTAFFSRATMSRTNIELVRMLAECGQKNLIIIIVIPSFFVLDWYAAIPRSMALIHIYTDRKNHRGYFKYYDRKRKKALYMYGKKKQSYGYAQPNFMGRFTNHYTVSEKDYRAKKKASLEQAFAGGGISKDRTKLYKVCALLHFKYGFPLSKFRTMISNKFTKEELNEYYKPDQPDQ